MPGTKDDLMKYRLEMAKERLHSSKVLLDAGSYKDSIGRSYYAMFTAVSCVVTRRKGAVRKSRGISK